MSGSRFVIVLCIAALLGAVVVPDVGAQPRNSVPAAAPPPPLPQGVSRGENFSAKQPAALFASDCTGSGCHRGPQGLAKDKSQSGLSGFLREHYTNSRESASALAAYLLGPTSAMRTPPPQPEPAAPKPRQASRTEEPNKPPAEGATPPTPPSRPHRAEPATPSAPASQRTPRGRQTTAATPELPAAPPAPPPPPPPPAFDIFD